MKTVLVLALVMLLHLDRCGSRGCRCRLRPAEQGQRRTGGSGALPVVGADLHSLVIDPTDPERLFIGSYQGVSISTDGGKTWDAVGIPAGASLVEFSPDDPETLYAAVHEDPEARVWISTDDGAAWEQLQGPTLD